MQQLYTAEEIGRMIGMSPERVDHEHPMVVLMKLNRVLRRNITVQAVVRDGVRCYIVQDVEEGR